MAIDQDDPIIERVVFNGVELPLAEMLPLVNPSEEASMRIFELIDMLEENESAQFLISTCSTPD